MTPDPKPAAGETATIWPKCPWCETKLEPFAKEAGRCPKCGACVFPPAAPSPASSPRKDEANPTVNEEWLEKKRLEFGDPDFIHKQLIAEWPAEKPEGERLGTCNRNGSPHVEILCCANWQPITPEAAPPPIPQAIFDCVKLAQDTAEHLTGAAPEAAGGELTREQRTDEETRAFKWLAEQPGLFSVADVPALLVKYAHVRFSQLRAELSTLRRELEQKYLQWKTVAAKTGERQLCLERVLVEMWHVAQHCYASRSEEDFTELGAYLRKTDPPDEMLAHCDKTDETIAELRSTLERLERKQLKFGNRRSGVYGTCAHDVLISEHCVDCAK